MRNPPHITLSFWGFSRRILDALYTTHKILHSTTFHSEWPYYVILSAAKNLRCIMSFWAQRRILNTLHKILHFISFRSEWPYLSFWAQRRILNTLHKILHFISFRSEWQQKKCYIYNIMSYPTFWHQKNLRNPTPQLRYLSIFHQKFTTIVNFTKTVKNWHLFLKNSLFHRKCEKICILKILDYT
jgi:hypothetical protein